MLRDFYGCIETRAGRTPSIPNRLVASFEHVSEMRLAYVNFAIFSTRPAHVSLICCCVTAV